MLVLLDQNIPREVGSWLRVRHPQWETLHTSEVGLQAATDRAIFDWAQERDAVIVTFDEDFADQRDFPVGSHRGIVRLRVWPTTVEQVQDALRRLWDAATDDQIRGALIVVDGARVRIRRESGRP